jgi:hypothetical protein
MPGFPKLADGLNIPLGAKDNLQQRRGHHCFHFVSSIVNKADIK